MVVIDIDGDEESVNFTASDVTRCQWLLGPSEDGEYESTAGVGEPLFDSWVEWVLRGHHGEKS